MTTYHSASGDLEDDGPLVDVFIGPTKAAQDAMTAGGQALPPPVPAVALIDTGASLTCVQAGLLSPLGLHPVGTVLINTPTTADTSCSLYAVRLSLPNGYIDVSVIEAPLQGQNIQALIGRDVLKHGVFIYNGYASSFTLSY